MGIRMTQFIGLNQRAKDWLRDNVELIKSNVVICPHCGREISHEMVENKVVDGRSCLGMFCEEISLLTYILKNGRLACEVVQAEPWSSGPMIFTHLYIDGEEGLAEKEFVGSWTGTEIEEML